MIRLGNVVLRNASCCATQRFLVPNTGLHCVGPSLQDLRDIYPKTPSAVPSPPHHQSYRLKSTKGKKGKGGGGKPDIDDLIDALSDDEFEDEAEPEEELKEFKETPLSKLLKSSKKGPSGKGSKKDSGKQGGGSVIKYEMFVRVVDGEKLWQELDDVVVNLKQYYIQHLSVRSATSLDNLPVELEGDKYPLNELALISKKDPKRLVIDASSFPQATANIMSAIRDAGMNLNPQQDGLRIFVPIPKVNKEFREKLVVGARKKLNSTKDELRSVQNVHTKRMEESDPPPGVSKDDVKEAVATVRLITDSFIAAADQLLVIKTKELMGK